MSLSQTQIEIIKSTVPVLESYGNAITNIFYQDLLSDVPSLNNLFNHGHQITGHQAQALAGALYAYASNIDKLSVLRPALERISQKHVALYVTPEQYDLVGKYLVQSMGKVLGDALTPEITRAWLAAYQQLADIMINREKVLYQEAGDWQDWREFRIVKKVPESSQITSFYFEPTEATGPLLKYKAGQYVSVQVDVSALRSLQPRQYSLSDSYHPDYYRVSVKRESGINVNDPDAAAHPGYVSNVLHDNKQVGDTVNLSSPRGEFFLDNKLINRASPVILISAGVGITPMISITTTLLETSSTTRPIHFIHVSRNKEIQPFTSTIRRFASHQNVKTIICHTKPSSDEKQGTDYDYAGRLDLKTLHWSGELLLDSKNNDNDDNTKPTYYICGRDEFMNDVSDYLVKNGASADDVHKEVFGVGDMIPGATK